MGARISREHPATGKTRRPRIGKKLARHPNRGHAVARVTFDKTMWRRALKVSLLVGTVLNLINSGDSLLAGRLPPHAWKIPLTYLVPIAVSLYSSAAERRKK